MQREKKWRSNFINKIKQLMWSWRLWWKNMQLNRAFHWLFNQNKVSVMTNIPIFNCITATNRKTWHLSLYGTMRQNWWGLFPAIPLPTVHSIWLRITDNFWHLCDYRGLFCTVFIYPGLQEFIFNRTFKNAVNTKYANCVNKRIPTPKVYFFLPKHTLGPSSSVGVNW